MPSSGPPQPRRADWRDVRAQEAEAARVRPSRPQEIETVLVPNDEDALAEFLEEPVEPAPSRPGDAEPAAIRPAAIPSRPRAAMRPHAQRVRRALIAAAAGAALVTAVEIGWRAPIAPALPDPEPAPAATAPAAVPAPATLAEPGPSRADQAADVPAAPIGRFLPMPSPQPLPVLARADRASDGALLSHAAIVSAAAFSPPAVAVPATDARELGLELARSTTVVPAERISTGAVPDAAAANSPPSASSVHDRDAIDEVLARYQTVLSHLNVNAARVIWPAVNSAALERAFDQLERQTVTFNSCAVAIAGAGATARCQGRVTYVPKVGSRTARTDSRQWQIDLRKMTGGWRIEAVKSSD